MTGQAKQRVAHVRARAHAVLEQPVRADGDEGSDLDADERILRRSLGAIEHGVGITRRVGAQPHERATHGVEHRGRDRWGDGGTAPRSHPPDVIIARTRPGQGPNVDRVAGSSGAESGVANVVSVASSERASRAMDSRSSRANGRCFANARARAVPERSPRID